jgi:hypothetical protein
MQPCTGAALQSLYRGPPWAHDQGLLVLKQAHLSTTADVCKLKKPQITCIDYTPLCWQLQAPVPWPAWHSVRSRLASLPLACTATLLGVVILPTTPSCSLCSAAARKLLPLSHPKLCRYTTLASQTKTHLYTQCSLSFTTINSKPHFCQHCVAVLSHCSFRGVRELGPTASSS